MSVSFLLSTHVYGFSTDEKDVNNCFCFYQLSLLKNADCSLAASNSWIYWEEERSPFFCECLWCKQRESTFTWPCNSVQVGIIQYSLSRHYKHLWCILLVGGIIALWKNKYLHWTWQHGNVWSGPVMKFKWPALRPWTSGLTSHDIFLPENGSDSVIWGNLLGFFLVPSFLYFLCTVPRPGEQNCRSL